MAEQNEDGSINVELDDDDLDQKNTAIPEEGVDDGSHEDDDEDDVATGEDQNLADGGEVGEEGEDRSAIRERRRQERQERKQRIREREETLRRELSSRDTQIAQMRQELNVIHNRNSGSELAQLRNAKEKAQEAYTYYKDQIRLGTESQNGAAVADATEKLMLVKNKIDQLDNVEKAYKRGKQQPQPLDPRIANNARSWIEKNHWYDPAGKDQDSRVVLMLDQTLADEGFDPLTPEYWEELGSRVKKYLPHRATRGNIGIKPKSVISGGGREGGSTKGSTFRLSAERVQALKDAGKWEDLGERNKMIKQYRDYDRNGSNEGAR